MITLNKEILMHPDFGSDFENELCLFLENLIDAEFEKGDDTDFDFIDECADAINAIRSGDISACLPVISRKDFMSKVSKISSGSKVKIAVAICAVFAIIFGANTVIKNTTDTDIINIATGFIGRFFSDETKPIELTYVPSTTQKENQTETKAPAIIGISVKTDESFKNEYFAGETFSSKGLTVYAEYDNGEKLILRKGEYTVTVSSDFGKTAKYETVTVQAESFTETIEVRVIETVETKKLSSIYASFPEDFDFTAKDLNNIKLDGMEVYAVYSDESEKKLSQQEYTVEFADESTFFEKKTLVTVSYEGCSTSFIMTKSR